MKISPELLADLKYLAWYYEWSQNVKDHVKKAIQESPREFMHYLSSLAQAHRVGYAESCGRGLAVWCAEHGVPHPYVGELEEITD
jgi:predicted metal-binding transcription factor (methanogenesis marker protein 9)